MIRRQWVTVHYDSCDAPHPDHPDSTCHLDAGHDGFHKAVTDCDGVVGGDHFGTWNGGTWGCWNYTEHGRSSARIS
jgi:hypothetical protein